MFDYEGIIVTQITSIMFKRKQLSVNCLKKFTHFRIFSSAVKMSVRRDKHLVFAIPYFLPSHQLNYEGHNFPLDIQFPL